MLCSCVAHFSYAFWHLSTDAMRMRSAAGDLMFDNWDAFSEFLRRMRTPQCED